jgi:3-oxoacyl-[acyl-carrier-protein] synthase-3
MVGRSIGILGTGSYLPENSISNEVIAARVGVTPDWIATKTQIEHRRFASDEEATSDLATHAARRALEQAGLRPSDVDYLIVSTSTGDSPQPPTANLVQNLLGADGAACFDINAVCSGFVYGLAVAEALIATRPDSIALVVAADIYSRILDFSDRRTAVLFGDGAGAAVVGAVPAERGLIGLHLRGSGEAHHLIRVEAGGSRRPPSVETVADGGHFFRMEGRQVREFAVKQVPVLLTELLERNGLGVENVDHFVPHQANGVLVDELAQNAGLTTARIHRTLERYGNAGSASVALTLDEANRANELKDGDLVLLAGFGGGMSVGACLLRWYDPLTSV